MFQFNFQRRKDKALGLFSRALADLQQLNEDTTYELSIREKEEGVLRQAADELRADSQVLERDRQAVLSTIARLRALIAV